jgi:hypothetical protein
MKQIFNQKVKKTSFSEKIIKDNNLQIFNEWMIKFKSKYNPYRWSEKEKDFHLNGHL